MEKLDLTKKYKRYYTAANRPELVETGPAQYRSLTGKGDPSAPEFAERIQAVYATAYTVKFMFKAQNRDFVVSKLEGLWWYDENRHPNVSFSDSATRVPRAFLQIVPENPFPYCTLDYFPLSLHLICILKN